MEILILALLFLLNGLLAMSEIAIVSSRKVRLQQLAREGSKNALLAMKLANEPTRFLSTIQVGITLVGILSGAYGEAALSGRLSDWLEQFPELAPYREILSLIIVVMGITYFSLIIGELAPKRLALHWPERIAMLMARPMRILAVLVYPLVRILSWSTDLVLKLACVRSSDEPLVTEKEIRLMVEQGAEAGVFLKTEPQMVANVLKLDNLRIGAVMTPRLDIYYLDLEDSEEENRRKLIESPYSGIPVCQDGMDNLIGIVQAKSMLRRALRGDPLDFAAAAKPALCVPKTSNPMQLLEEFKRTKTAQALVVDEYGEVAGMVTLKDVLEAIVGDIPTAEYEEEPEAVRREDGSWLLDGMLSVEKFKQMFGVERLPEEDSGDFHTVGGFVMLQLGYVPRATDHFEWDRFRFEVVDMDRNRVDKVLLTTLR